MATGRHPIDAIIVGMSRRDQEIANELAEQGLSDEDLYAALPNPGADSLLKKKPKPAISTSSKGGA